MTFHSSKFLEGSDGSLGFHVLFLFPILVILLPFLGTFETSCLAIITLVYVTTVYLSQSYLRYIYPALPGYLILCSQLIAQGTANRPKIRQIVASILVLLVGINLYFRPSASFWFRDFNPQINFSANSQRSFVEVFAPERIAIEYLNMKYGSSYALLQLRMPYVGLAMGEVHSLTWHHANFANLLAKASSEEEMKAYFIKNHITHICRRSDLSTQQTSGYEKILNLLIEKYSKVEATFSYLEIRKFSFQP
jgi:hypothetical protein